MMRVIAAGILVNVQTISVYGLCLPSVLVYTWIYGVCNKNINSFEIILHPEGNSRLAWIGDQWLAMGLRQGLKRARHPQIIPLLRS